MIIFQSMRHYRPAVFQNQVTVLEPKRHFVNDLYQQRAVAIIQGVV